MLYFTIPGLPKPANVNQSKAIIFSKFLQFCELEPEDRVYAVTPLYHSAATCALYSVIDKGRWTSNITYSIILYIVCP